MVCTSRFLPGEMQKQPEVQPDSPVYIHCSRRCEEASTGAVFVQVRMVNCSGKTVQTVILQIEGLNDCGTVLYSMHDIILSECKAKPHSVFGDDRILALERTEVARLRITAERVAFEDGTVWCRRAEQKTVDAEAAGWNECTCGMRNPPESDACLLCGRLIDRELPIGEAPLPFTAPEDFPEIRVPYIEMGQPEEYRGTEQTEPIVRNFYTVTSESEEEHTLPRGVVVLLCVFGILALTAATCFLAYVFMQYLGKI